MKDKEIATRFRLDVDCFEAFLQKHNFKHRITLSGYAVDDDKVEEYVEKYYQYLEWQKHEDERRKEAEQKKAALANMLITSGFTFDGYRITKYSGYISGDDAVQISRGTSGFFSKATDVGASLMSSLVKIRRNALAELKEAAYDLGCNAVIGVDFDYITLDPETANSSGGTTYLPYVFGVTANGNAVVIDKIDKGL